MVWGKFAIMLKFNPKSTASATVVSDFWHFLIDLQIVGSIQPLLILTFAVVFFRVSYEFSIDDLSKLDSYLEILTKIWLCLVIGATEIGSSHKY